METELFSTKKQKVLLRSVTGSRAHGTDHALSDWDLRTVYLVPTSRLLSFGFKDKFVKVPGTDENAWEFGHFLNLCMHGNPSTLEVLLAPSQYTTPEGDELRKMFPHFLARKQVGGAFRGFAEKEKRTMFSIASKRQPKCIANYLRVLYNARELLLTGTMTVRIRDTPMFELVMRAKMGGMTPEEALPIGERMEAEMQEAFERSTLPERANVELINEFLLRIRKQYWDFDDEEEIITTLPAMQPGS